MAFIFAFAIILITIVVCGFMLYGSEMSDSPSASRDANEMAKYVFEVGIVIAIVVGASHWLPHIGW